jgi:pimeloyl-ACP methyl ester carboxylesterase
VWLLALGAGVVPVALLEGELGAEELEGAALAGVLVVVFELLPQQQEHQERDGRCGWRSRQGSPSGLEGGHTKAAGPAPVGLRVTLAIAGIVGIAPRGVWHYRVARGRVPGLDGGRCFTGNASRGEGIVATHGQSIGTYRRGPVTAAIVLAGAFALMAAFAPGAMAKRMQVQRVFMPGFTGIPGPAEENYVPPRGARLGKVLNLDQVGVVKIGSPSAKNVIVLEPGTSAGAPYFIPFAKSLVARDPEWQVWAVERRENLLEDQTRLNRAKSAHATAEEVFNYYLGFITNSEVKHHFLPLVPPFLRTSEAEVLNHIGEQWGMNVAVQDLHIVIEAAKALGGKVVLGGHSLGGSVVTAYATWDFGGTPGADGLSGLVYDDGGSSPVPISKEAAETDLTNLDARKNPWLAFGGIESPFLGLFSALGSSSTLAFPKETSLAEAFPLLPEALKPRSPEGCSLKEPGCELVPVTNEAEFGFGVNVGTSPPSLVAAQAHVGTGVAPSAEEDGLHGWDGTGALTPLHRYAEMLAGAGLQKADGSEWYFPERLTIDTGAVAEGNNNPAQEVLGEHAIHGHELPTSLKILAINSELDKDLGANSLVAAEILAEQSGIPSENLTLINVENTYAHNDPAGAEPEGEGIDGNIFFKELSGFLEGIAAG